jgi:hypothetical protein
MNYFIWRFGILGLVHLLTSLLLDGIMDTMLRNYTDERLHITQQAVRPFRTVQVRLRTQQALLGCFRYAQFLWFCNLLYRSETRGPRTIHRNFG